MNHAFHKINGYPWYVIDQVSISSQENIYNDKSPYHSVLILQNNPLKKCHQGSTIFNTLNKSLELILPNNVKARVTYTGQKPNTKFQLH